MNREEDGHGREKQEEGEKEEKEEEKKKNNKPTPNGQRAFTAVYAFVDPPNPFTPPQPKQNHPDSLAVPCIARRLSFPVISRITITAHRPQSASRPIAPLSALGSASSASITLRWFNLLPQSSSSTLSFPHCTLTPLLRSIRPTRLSPPAFLPATRLLHRSPCCADISSPSPALRGSSGIVSVMNGVRETRPDRPTLNALETDQVDTPLASPDTESQKCCSDSYHSNSDTSSPSSTATPPLNPYRRTVRTVIQKVDSHSITFAPSSTEPGVHPYEDPTIAFSSDETRSALEAAAELLKIGQCVAFPTETVYGLGADATCNAAVRSIYSAKARPADNPLIVHIASLKQLRRLLPCPFSPTRLLAPEEEPVEEETIPEVYLPLIQRFWPGPLTILLPLPIPSPLSPNVTSTQPTFAARMPHHPIALALSAISKLPIAAPSANASGRPSPTTAQHVYTDLNGKIPLIIDGGSADVGLESTVVDGLHDPPMVLRPGGISAEELRECGGIWERLVVAKRGADDTDVTPRAPGMKYKHYSPRAGVILYDVGANPPTSRDILNSARYLRVGIVRTRTWKEGFAQAELEACRQKYGPMQMEIFERSLGSDGKDIGRGLFAVLRELDELGVDVIHVEGIEESDEGLAVMNRLGKAASVVVRKVSR